MTRWILGLYDRIDQTENSVTSRREFDFAPATGFLDCLRTLKNGTARNANDLLVRYTPTASGGFVAQERFYGGDRQSIGTSGACSDGSLPEYSLDHTYQYGARKSSKYAAMSWKFLDLVIDAGSGLPSSSTDAAGMVTAYTFDALNRITRVEPLAKSGFAPEAWTKYSYILAGDGVTGGNAAIGGTAVVERCRSGVSCTGSGRLTSEYVDSDRLGRVYQEGRGLPGGGSSIRRTFYDAAGNRSQVSTFKDSATGSFLWTTFSGYDPFGRPASVSWPDGRTTSFSRAGDRTVETTQSIALSLTGTETNVKRRETFDRQGRLFRVEEYANPSAPSTYVKTDYGYDESGRLIRVCQNSSGSSCGQERLFAYDRRGFLLSEKHPEKGASGNGFVHFKTLDSRGNVWKRRDGVDDTTRELNFTYDAAERLLSVTPASGPALKSFTYDTAPGAGAGKLHTATRRNDLPVPWGTNYQVTETYSYQGRMGWPSSRTTALSSNGSPQESWTFTAGYHELGLVDTLGYPECVGTGCTNHSDEPLAVGFGYEGGLLTSIPNWTSSQSSQPIGYHPNLLVASLAHGNGMTVTIANDPNRLERPRSISVAALDDEFQPVTAWATGDYLYDGAGNVKSIGADQYQYDKVSRLVASNLAASAPGRSQSYTFDLYGNLTSKTTDGGGAINFPTSTATNRLTGATSYDAAGNQTGYNANVYGFDLLNTMTTLDTGGELWGYVYTADDERVLALKSDGSKETWTLRDFGNRILRRDEWISGNGEQTGTGTSSACPAGSEPIYCQDFESGSYLDWDLIVSGPIGSVTDYVWRGERLFASGSTQGGARHFALDHLGTVRLVTDDFGQVAEQHAYFPFGEEATGDVSTEPMRFTGHERDLQSTPSNAADDLDQMHARFCSPLTGRFLSVDPAGESAIPEEPQSWHRYASHANNPLKYVDPDGQVVETPFDIAMAVVSIGQAIAAPTPGNIAGAILDVAAVVVPGVPAIGGRAIDAVQAADKVIDAGKTAEKLKDGAKAATRGGESAKARYGREQHELFKDTVKQKEGWDPNPRIKGPDGKELRPDALTRSGRPIELKPNTPSGRRQGRAQLRRYEQATGKRGRVVYYDPPRR
jgi:RHS repeat-associated protein